MTSFPLAAKASTIIITFVALAACSPKPDSTADSTAAASSSSVISSTDTASPPTSSGMAGMTGDPDRDFLRMMSDHHKGLIAMVHPTLDSKEKLSIKGDAAKMDKKQDAELDKMITMLDQQYKDAYTPSVMPDNQRMVDGLAGKSGVDYSRTFLQNVITHHKQAIKMVDEYLPKARNPQVKAMAEKMKSDQGKEIADFQKKLGAM